MSLKCGVVKQRRVIDMENYHKRMRELVEKIVGMNYNDNASIDEIYEKIGSSECSKDFITGVVFSIDVLHNIGD